MSCEMIAGINGSLFGCNETVDMGSSRRLHFDSSPPERKSQNAQPNQRLALNYCYLQSSTWHLFDTLRFQYMWGIQVLGGAHCAAQCSCIHPSFKHLTWN